MTATLAVVCAVAFLGSTGLCAANSEAPLDVLVASMWSLGGCQDVLVQAGALELARVWVDSEWWRVGSTGVLHGSLIHVALNTWSLVSVGEWAERLWGWWRLLALFALSSVAGCLATLAWSEAPLVVGASAGVFGIAGALLGARVLGGAEARRVLAPISVGMLGGCLAVLLVIGFFVPLIAQAGHIGGLAVGGVLGVGWSRQGLTPRAASLLVALSIGAGLVGLAARPAGREGYDELVGYRLLERGEHRKALVALDRALVRRPGDARLANAVAYALAEANIELERGHQLVVQALDAEPENADYLDTLGWIECRRGNTAAGLLALDQAEAAAAETIPEVALHRRTCSQ